MVNDMIGYIVTIIIVIIVAAVCCSSDSNTSGNAPRNTSTNTNRNRSYSRSSYSDCPSCGAPGFDGYCEECGYPDVNQGWLGENY